MVCGYCLRNFWRGVLFWGVVAWVFSFFVSKSVGAQDKFFYFGVAVPVVLLLVFGDGGKIPKVILGVVALLFILSVPVFWSGDAEYLNLVGRYARYFILTSCVFLAPFLLRKDIDRLSRFLLWAIIVGAFIAALLQWLKFALVLNFELAPQGIAGVGGVGVNPNVTGAAMGVAFLVAGHMSFSLDKGWVRTFLTLACLLFFASICLAFARTAFVAVFMVLVMNRFPIRDFFVYYILLFVLCVFLLAVAWGVYGLDPILAFADRLLSGRVSIWRQLLHDVSGHWWFGLGLQRELEFYNPGPGVQYMTAHNIYFQAFRNGGFFALTALVSLVVLIVRNVDRGNSSYVWRSILSFGLLYALIDAYYYPVSDPNSNWLFLWLPAGYLLVAAIERNGGQERGGRGASFGADI